MGQAAPYSCCPSGRKAGQHPGVPLEEEAGLLSACLNLALFEMRVALLAQEPG